MPHWPRAVTGLCALDPSSGGVAQGKPSGAMATIQDAAPPDTMAVASQGGRKTMAFVGPVVVALALLSALATFLVLAGLTPIPPSHYTVKGLLTVNAIAVLVMLGIIVREVWPIVQARRGGG